MKYKMQWRHSDRWIDDFVGGNEQQVIQKAIWRKERKPNEYIRVVAEVNGNQTPVFFA